MATLALIVLSLAPGALAAVSRRQSYDVPAGDAEKTLHVFTQQSGEQILYPPALVSGVTTNAVKGEFTSREALERMTAGTALKVVADQKTGALTLKRDSDPNGDGAAPVTPGASPKSRNDARNAVAAEEPVVLSPFEVLADQETGYVASQTLAGTRIATDIRNVAAQVTVMTPEFLQDIAAANLDEALLYSLNVENHQEYAEEAVADGTRGVQDLNAAQRVRGLSTASNTRDFFESAFALDTYNSERFTFNSGPNAILFGLGSPAGVIDQSLKRARFKDSSQFGLRLDDWGSRRAQLDLNRKIIPNVLAVRGSFLYDHEESWKQPSRDLQRRQYVTATYRPFKATTIRVAFENIRRAAAIPRNTLVKDFVTPYLDWRAQRMQALGIADPLDPRLYWAPNTQLGPGESPFATGVGTPFAPNTTPGTTAQSIILVTGQFAPNTPATSLLNRVNGAVNARNPIGATMRSRGPHEDVRAPDDFNYSLTDASLFPRDVNVGGLGTDNHQRGKVGNVFIEHQFSRRFAVEAAFQKQTYRQVFEDWIRGADHALQIDVNRYLPNVTDEAGRPVLNPNRGRYFVESWGRGRYSEGETDAARFTGSYRLDFTGKSGWRRWLGTHNFAGLVDFTRSRDGVQAVRALLYSDSPDVNINNPALRANRAIIHRVYLDAPGAGGTSYYDVNSAVRGLHAQPYGPAREATVGLWPTNPAQGVWGAGTRVHEQSIGRMLALQSLWWKDRIAVTYGKRTDAFKSNGADTPQVDPVSPASSRPWYWNTFTDVRALADPTLDGELDVDETGRKETRGIVVAPYPFVSFHYNQSSNRQAGSPGPDPNTGGYHAPSSGEGEDYGFALRLADSRIFLKANWYVNEQTRSSSKEFAGTTNAVRGIENRLLVLSELYPEVGYQRSRTWEPESRANAPVLADLSARGLELTLTANPTHQWRVALTAAKTKSTEVNIAQEWITYVESRDPEWAKFHDYPRSDSASAKTIREAIASEVMFEYLDRARLVDGRPSAQVRKWRVNFVTNYDFTSGWFRNFGLGGAVRWRDRASIGLPLITLPDGNVVQDIAHPWYDDGLTDIDGWLSYKAKLLEGKVRSRFQLNVRNLFDTDKLLPQKAATTGERRLFTLQPPRRIMLSVTFDL